MARLTSFLILIEWSHQKHYWSLSKCHIGPFPQSGINLAYTVIGSADQSQSVIRISYEEFNYYSSCASLKSVKIEASRPTFAQIWSFKIRCTTSMNYTKLADTLPIPRFWWSFFWKGRSGSCIYSCLRFGYNERLTCIEKNISKSILLK